MKNKKYDDTYLERLAAFFESSKNQSYALLKPQAIDLIIDVGCGTGDDTIHLTTYGATVYGVDHDPELINLAQKKADKVSSPVTFLCSEANAIPLSSSSIDKIRYDRIFQHLPDHTAILEEAHRLLKPGGIIQILDSDYLSLTFFMEDIGLERKIVDIVAYKRLPHSHKVRCLPLVLEDVGFDVLNIIIHNYLIDEFSFANYMIHFDDMVREAFGLGNLTKLEFDHWQYQRNKPKGKFNMSFNLMTIMATKQREQP